MAIYTVSSCIEAIKRLIEEASDENVVTSNQLIQFIADCEQKVATSTQCLTDIGTVTLVADTVYYTPPTGTSSVIDVLYNYPNGGYKSLTRVEPGSIPPAADSSYPYYWYYRGSKLWLFPAIAELPDTATVTVIFAKLPARVSALADNLSIPDDFQLIVPYQVAQLVALKDNQPVKAQQLDAIIQQLSFGGITSISKQGSYTSSSPAGQAS